MAARPVARYRWAGAALLRASTDPGGLDLPEDLDLLGEDAAEQGLAWLSALWQREEVRAAFLVASPALAGRVDALLAEGGHDARTVRRAVLSVASYLLRWQRRPTPFGLFAGVGAARIGTGVKVRWGGQHRVALRADAGWVGGFLARLHQCGELRERLPVVVNDTATVRGDRVVAPGPVPDGDGSGHELAPLHGLAALEVSVRHSRPVRAALDAARHPVPWGELRTLLLRRFPNAQAQQIDGLLVGLLDQGLLLSDLSAPLTCLDPLGHLCGRLQAAAAHTIPEIQDLVGELAGIHHDLSAKRPGAAPRLAVTERMKAVSKTTDMPLVVETVLDCDVQLPEQVAREASDAVGVLHRLSPYPWGYPAWRDYHTRFRARYGTGAFVPVLELVADSGLGLPAGYLGSASGRAARQVSERDEKLLALIQRATLDGSGELILTDQVIEELAPVQETELVHLPARVEVAVEVHAASVEALTRGRFALTVTGTPRPASSMIGRHVHSLPAEDRAVIAETFAAVEPGTIAAQLSFPPRKRRNENVARADQLLPHVIGVAEHREGSERLIPLADLAVTADERRFDLVQVSTGRRVAPRVPHALEAGVQTPPLARLLAEITTARAAVYKAFDVGAAARLPYLPRVRYRRTTLSAARWLLTARDVPGRAASMAAWEAGLDAWRATWRVPDRVALVDHDRRQPVELGHRLHRLLLRTRLEQAGRIELRETANPEDLAWLGRAHEVLLCLVLDASTAASATVPVAISSPPRAAPVDAGHLPGKARIVCAQLFGHPARFNEILTERLTGLLDGLGDTLGEEAGCWWFRRHRHLRHPDADQYLAVYLRLPAPSAYAAAAGRLAAWAQELRRDRLLSHLALATYEPQSGRYGHGPALERAQDFFVADSAAAIAQIAVAVRAGARPEALAAASLVDLAVRFTESASAGTRWLVREIPQHHGWLEPDLRDQALELADTGGVWATLQLLPGGAAVVTAWQQRAAALAAYRERLAGQRDPHTVLPSLLHTHHLRAVGVDPDVERVTTRLARTCALRHIARHPET